MNPKTASESAFEEFCESNEITFEKITEGTDPTPDYLIRLNGVKVYVEVKEIGKDADFSSTLQLRTPGEHIRAKINKARNQVRPAAVRLLFASDGSMPAYRLCGPLMSNVAQHRDPHDDHSPGNESRSVL